MTNEPYILNSLVRHKKAPPYKFHQRGRDSTQFNLKFVSGVYLIYEKGKVVYIGASDFNLYKSLYRHFEQWNDNRGWKHLTFDKDKVLVEVIYCNPENSRLLADELILKYKPIYNKYRESNIVSFDFDKREILKKYISAPKKIINYKAPKEIPKERYVYKYNFHPTK